MSRNEEAVAIRKYIHLAAIRAAYSGQLNSLLNLHAISVQRNNTVLYQTTRKLAVLRMPLFNTNYTDASLSNGSHLAKNRRLAIRYHYRCGR